jgi:hypothetical protein
MMNDPILVWPPGTLYTDCNQFGNLYDCSYMHPDLQQQGYVACCLAY